MRAQQGQQPGQPGQPTGANLGGNVVPQNVNVDTAYYYQFIGGNRELVMADAQYVNSLKHQYLAREADGRMRKVVGDPNFTTPQTQAAAKPNVNLNQPVANRTDVKPEVAKQMAAMKKEQAVADKKTTAKSKANKKTIKGI